MLELACEDDVEDPVEAEDGVDDHGAVVEVGVFVAEDRAEEGVFGVGVAETPVHGQIPDS